jgi:SNF2 family DNA or RNA helicase
MLTEDRLLQLFNEETSGNRQAEGQRVLKNDLISAIDVIAEEKLLCITGNVISENLFNEYSTKLELDADRLAFVSTSCSCDDFEKNFRKKTNYCCKHLVATFYKSMEDLAKHPLLRNEQQVNSTLNRLDNNILELLLDNALIKEELKIEVYINKSEWNDNINAEFKIGLSKISSSNLYCLKDLNQFLSALENNISISYSKNFSFNLREQKLSSRDRRLIDFIYTLKELEGKYKYLSNSSEPIIVGKLLNIPNSLVREFINTISGHRVYLNEGFFHRPIETEIIEDRPPVDFDLKIIKDNYILKSPNGMPIVLGTKNDVFLYGTSIYLPDYSYCYKLSPFIKVFNPAKAITIPVSQEEEVLKKLIPELNLLSPKVTLAKVIEDKIVLSECGFSFYFDMESKILTLTLKVKYGSYEFNIFEDCQEKIIYRDLIKEQELIGKLKGFCFEEYKGKFYLEQSDDYIFNFLKNEINKLQYFGEVYYSQNFKGIKGVGSKGIIGNIKSGKYDYFHMDFKIGDIPPKDYIGILRAFRDNVKYYKLEDGGFIDLQELELKKFLKLLDSVSIENIQNSHAIIPKSKALYIDNYIEEEALRYIKGRNEIKSISKRLKEVHKLQFLIPATLMANLREYQKVGYNWLMTLDYLGFGGILGDEMGLGKTLQTIAFILAKKETKTLIVAPTSLIYNWKSEFEKFAPTVRVAAVNSTKEEREEIIRQIKNYDVLVTTYNLLKRDLEVYSDIEFDYCILDEAQNIKNSNSQNALAAKALNSKRRFALSGTPIENSLMELWSIFDFIMPGYLFDEKRFNVRYHKKLREEPEVIVELNRLIKPFILRRKKRDVIKELPDKIEKTLMISMDEEQKKVYKAYADYALELIAKKVKEEEFKNSKIEILSYITKLRQLCLDPSVVMDEYKGSSGKMEALLELLHQSIEEGHRVLVFSQFTSVLKNISKRLNNETITFSYLDGSMSSEKRMSTVEAFNNGESSVFLISLKAGGTGLNLTSADIVVHFDPWWNPAVEEQATDRAHRIGQHNVVEVIKIIAKGTVEEKILALQSDKKKLISQLMDNQNEIGDFFSSMSEEDVLDLFTSIPGI